MNGKSSPPSLLDKLGGKVVALTLDTHTSTKPILSKLANKALVSMCRSVAEKGEMLPLGLLPQNGKPFEGKAIHTSILTETLNPNQTKTLLNILKRKGLTLAPFMEAVDHMATMWVRKHRLLSPLTEWENSNRILCSFSNTISKRNTLLPEHQRYFGLCMSGFPTKVAASSAIWSTRHTIPSPTDSRDSLPYVVQEDLKKLCNISNELKEQYIQCSPCPKFGDRCQGSRA